MEREQDTLEGVVEDIIYKNDENGYTVARVELDDGGAITIVGAMPFLGAGEHISATGAYTVHPQHGPQFQVENYLREMPADEAGIYAYLASRTVKGIGPKTAARIVEHFGDQTLLIMEREPGRLAEVPGISREKARAIGEEFRLQRRRARQEIGEGSAADHVGADIGIAHDSLGKGIRNQLSYRTPLMGFVTKALHQR